MGNATEQVNRKRTARRAAKQKAYNQPYFGSMTPSCISEPAPKDASLIPVTLHGAQ
jgi:hypothetical protein